MSLLDESWLPKPSEVVLGFCKWHLEMFTDTHERHFFSEVLARRTSLAAAPVNEDDRWDMCLETRPLGQYTIESMVYCWHLPSLVNATWL